MSIIQIFTFRFLKFAHEVSNNQLSWKGARPATLARNEWKNSVTQSKELKNEKRFDGSFLKGVLKLVDITKKRAQN